MFSNPEKINFVKYAPDKGGFWNLHCSWESENTLLFILPLENESNETLRTECHFRISQMNSWRWDSRVSGLFSFQCEQNKMNLTECNVLHTRNTSVWISCSISFLRWRGKYNWLCISKTCQFFTSVPSGWFFVPGFLSAQCSTISEFGRPLLVQYRAWTTGTNSLPTCLPTVFAPFTHTNLSLPTRVCQL